MRGKLRDKRSIAKRDYFKRDEAERRRLDKRDKRTNLQQLQIDDDDFIDDEEEELEDEREIPTPKK